MEKIKIFDTKLKRKVPLIPLKDNIFRIYTCGPTVYNYPHIGNYRTFLFEDLLRRYLKFKGYGVFQVMNITDVDDKTIRESNKNGVSLKEYTKKYIDSFFEELDMLGIERAEKYPKATEHITEMIEMVRILKDKGYAYESAGSVYFDISKFKEYGALSGTKRLSGDNISRIDHDEYDRENIKDFVLWKANKEGEPGWESPWGFGRPGWHIECSAMSMKYLGSFFDIHTGGVDNIFPHHENEIAQSVASTGDKFVNHWMHSEFLLVEGEKMSKSKGNYYTIRDLEKKGLSLQAFRYLVLSTHYRKQLNFTFDSLNAASGAINRLNDFIQRIKSIEKKEEKNPAAQVELEKLSKGFEEAMDDDLNSSRALGSVFDFIRIANILIDKDQVDKESASNIIDYFTRLNSIFNIMKIEDDMLSREISDLINERETARKKKDFKRADEIRDYLNSRGIILKDTKEGVVWQKT